MDSKDLKKQRVNKHRFIKIYFSQHFEISTFGKKGEVTMKIHIGSELFNLPKKFLYGTGSSMIKQQNLKTWQC